MGQRDLAMWVNFIVLICIHFCSIICWELLLNHKLVLGLVVKMLEVIIVLEERVVIERREDHLFEECVS